MNKRIGIPHPQHRQKAGNNALAFSASRYRYQGDDVSTVQTQLAFAKRCGADDADR
ncbi:hypothetical protein [Citrobacter portucalensis]|uniref:hypothetical protein n=1 Tax=Citrobacter portucalensis TaxID=1639133 RepID=UPI003CF4D185